tara:strand:+ start:2221 stop:2991 length:771 start_codon:yes stop_codon:yes gene_type:complete
MASSNNVRNAREIVEYYNRKFILDVNGSLGAGGDEANNEIIVNIPPLNETAFSGNYSQCLVRIKELSIALSLDPAADLYGKQANAVFVWDDAGTTTIASADVGVMIKTDIPCRNTQHLLAELPRPNFGMTQFHQSCPITTQPTYQRHSIVFDGLQTRGTTNLMINPDIKAAGNEEHSFSKSPHSFEYCAHDSIESAGLLCANPFGRRVSFKLVDAFNNVPLYLAGGRDITDAAGQGTALRIRLEVLMLENPTPSNR